MLIQWVGSSTNWKYWLSGYCTLSQSASYPQLLIVNTKNALTIILIVINRCSNLLSLYISFLSLLVLVVVLLSLLFIYTGSYYFLFSQSTFLVCVFFETFLLNNKKKSRPHCVHLFPISSQSTLCISSLLFSYILRFCSSCV